jgi:hypothetical protein
MPFVLALGGESFQLRRCYGISLLWLLEGWAQALDRLPRGAANALLRTLDRLAFATPEVADMIVSVWRPAKS